jgi:hypothetical protein
MPIPMNTSYRMPPPPPQGMNNFNAPTNDYDDDNDMGYSLQGRDGYSQSYSSSTSNGSINGVPFSYSRNGGGQAPPALPGRESDFFNMFSNAFGSGNSQMASINQTGPAFAVNFADGGYANARSGDIYSNQEKTSYEAFLPPNNPPMRNSYPPPPPAKQEDCYDCPPYKPMDYKEPPVANYPPTHHYQQNYAPYKETPIHFPQVRQYNFTRNPNIPNAPQMAAAPRFPNMPQLMPMPSLPPQIVAYGHPEAMKHIPAPKLMHLRPPSEAPEAPKFYCPPQPGKPGCDQPPVNHYRQSQFA